MLSCSSYELRAADNFFEGQQDTGYAGAPVFSRFVYAAGDRTSSDCCFLDNQIANPLLPGTFPDPSICRVGNDYYMVNSSFAFFPGVPIRHSTDLVHWTQLGYVLNRPSQLQITDGMIIKNGIYAPDIKYNPHNKLFYMITTIVAGGGNFYVTTDDPKKGCWSDPVFLPDVGGIDPSFFFDDDGKAYIVNNDNPPTPSLYNGHKAIWCREFDCKSGQTTGKAWPVVNGGVDISKHPIWIEGPHLYKMKGRYYIMAAEGGTSLQHSEVLFSADSPKGPFTPCPVNPILTQRDLDPQRPHPVTSTGHADLVQTPEGDWYAVFLGIRPYSGKHDIMGRETFILPVSWNEDQPIILPAGESISYRVKPVPPTPLWTKDGLSHDAFFIRTPQSLYYKIHKNGSLSLKDRAVNLSSSKQPSAIGRWITENSFEASTTLKYTPESPDDLAGLLVFKDDNSHITASLTADAEHQPCLLLKAFYKGETMVEEQVPLPRKTRQVSLKVKGSDEGFFTFYYALGQNYRWNVLGKPVPMDILSTHSNYNFTGTMVGIFSTSAGL